MTMVVLILSKLDAVARMGGDYYLRVQKDNIVTVAKPSDTLGMGLDQIPVSIRHSKVLTGNDLGRLGNAQRLPDQNEIRELRKSPSFRQIMGQGEIAVHTLAQKYLHEGKVHEAWCCCWRIIVDEFEVYKLTTVNFEECNFTACLPKRPAQAAEIGRGRKEMQHYSVFSAPLRLVVFHCIPFHEK